MSVIKNSQLKHEIINNYTIYTFYVKIYKYIFTVWSCVLESVFFRKLGFGLFVCLHKQLP